MYAVFKNIEEFDLWHDEIKEELGIPNDAGTLEYTSPIIHNEEVIALIDPRATNVLASITRDEAITRGFISEDISI